MIGTLDSQAIEKFKEFQEKTEKYLDLDIEKVEFENIALSDEKYFEFIKGRNHYIKRYNIANKGKYPLATGSVKNDSIAYYVKPINIADIITQKCISFNKDGDSQIFYRDYEFLMDRHHIAIIPSELVLAKYLYFALISYFKKMKFGWGENVADVPTVSTHSIPTPKDYNENYKSIDIQKAIVEFLEYSFDNLERIKSNIDKRYEIVTKMKKSLVLSTFKRTAIQNRFRKYAKENNINLEITDIEFDIRRVHSKKKDEVICKKRMGFTPKTDNNGDINWFSVSDLTNQDGLYIDVPNSTKKTTMKLIKEQVDSNNTGKSEKLIPIKKGDILVSFKLTVGTVKIYNSDLPAYCNEAIDILTLNEDFDNRYVAYNCMLEYPRNGNKTNNGITLNDDDKEKIRIFIPKDLQNYTSYKLQQILADFIEHIDNELEEKYFNKYNRAYEVVELLRETYLKRTFNKIVWS